MTGGVRRRNGRWQARYKPPDGKERSQTFDRKSDANAWLARQTASLLEGRWVDPRDTSTTFGEYADAWLSAHNGRPATIQRIEHQLRNHIKPTFGHIPIGAVRRSTVKSWITDLQRKGLAPSSIHTVFGVLSAVFNEAAVDQMITHKPTTRIGLPEVERHDFVLLTRDEVMGIAEAVPAHWRASIVVCVSTGLRAHELLGLTDDRVNMLRREVRVDRQLCPRGIDPLFRPLKSKASYRSVGLADVALEALAAHRANFQVGPSGLLFPGLRGGRPYYDRWSSAFRMAATQIGRPDVTPHDMRHFFASALIASGCSSKTVQTLMGHASHSETMDTYGHLWPDETARARVAINDVLTGADSAAVSSRSSRF